ncbi:MAG: type II secretion system F family protein [Acidobacteriota bacterium]|nr:type II secretion system F family protein [Acidobacteriota bacterium]
MLTALFLVFTVLLLLSYSVIRVIVKPAAKDATARRLQQVTTVGVQPAAETHRRLALGAALCSVASTIRTRTGLFVDEDLNRHLLCAGYTSPTALDLYTATRLSLPLGACLATALMPEGFGALWLLLTPVPAFLLPELLVRRKAAQRIRRIRRSVPDMLDLLVICVDAGLGLDQAVARVAAELETSHPDLAAEIIHVGRQQRAGKSRQQAWADLAARLQLPEIESFVGMILQTEKYGTPIARALAAFSQNNRLQRTQAAEEQAAKAAVKISIPLVLFIFPSIFIILLGPSILTALRAFRSQ